MTDLNAIDAADIVDARGSACPGPLLEAKKGLAKFRWVRPLKFFPTTAEQKPIFQHGREKWGMSTLAFWKRTDMTGIL